ncbi:dihydrofolate reductase [Desulfosporosinus nitroreducens]|uniref:dihydrofolate reductase n=1 Tax=Desulfosporosinus nitroreducens TaxID=2018668 RepID=A0ABT8QR85_9FIRM|nr:dihydrofolate reductase [Desulfosporosinus nitroreducens]MDO0823660.1 dihydrofolate reductase [Desulfosporosinus nitroreducens]
MKAIAAVDLNWGIGYRGNLLKRIPDDMKFFKQMTLGKVVIMGRETFESLPRQEPLKDRVNIVLSKNEHFNNEKVTLCRSLDELYSELEKYDTDDVFVVGGESVYSQLLAFCTEVYVTKIEEKYVADKYFVNLDKNKAWKLVSASNFKNYENIGFKFVKYVLVG